MSSVANKAEQLGQGNLGGNSHPLHPATVHFPLAFLSTGYFLDIVYGLSTHPATANTVRGFYNLTPFLGDVARLSYYVNLLGLITAVPAVLTGGAELMGMIKRQGLADKLERSQNKAATVQRMHPKLKVGFTHALLNDLSVFAAGYGWWTRRNAPMNVPSDLNVLLSAAVLPLLLFSGYLGSTMVFKYGVGVQRQGEGRRVKEEGKAQ